MNLTEIFSIIVIHWIADFVLQTDWQAKNKSKSFIPLILHTSTYSICWLIPCIILYNNNLPYTVLFILITLQAHTITDYFTSRLNSKLLAKGNTHYFFVSVGFDQVLHYIQLFLTYYYIKN